MNAIYYDYQEMELEEAYTERRSATLVQRPVENRKRFAQTNKRANVGSAKQRRNKHWNW